VFKIVDNLKEFIIIFDREGIVHYINRSAKDKFKLLKGDNIKEIFKKDERDIFFRNLVYIVYKHKQYGNFMRFIDKEGSIIFSYLNAFLYDDKVAFEIFDLTETENRSVSIDSPQYMKILKYMSQGIAHTIRNPIMSAGGILNIIQKKIPKEHVGEIEPYMQIVQKNLYKILNIIGEIETVSNSESVNLKKIAVKKEIEGIFEGYAKKMSDINFRVEGLDDVFIYIDKAHFYFMINEIIRNSLDALENKENGLISANIGKSGSNAVSIKIADNGVGMKDEDASLALIPFYSTKPSNIGIGLSLVKFLLDGYEGDMILNAKEDGMEVILTLPYEKRSSIRREYLESVQK